MSNTVELAGFLFSDDDRDTTDEVVKQLCDICFPLECKCTQLNVLQSLGLGTIRNIAKELGLDLDSSSSWEVLSQLSRWQ